MNTEACRPRSLTAPDSHEHCRHAAELTELHINRSLFAGQKFKSLIKRWKPFLEVRTTSACNHSGDGADGTRHSQLDQGVGAHVVVHKCPVQL